MPMVECMYAWGLSCMDVCLCLCMCMCLYEAMSALFMCPPMYVCVHRCMCVCKIVMYVWFAHNCTIQCAYARMCACLFFCRCVCTSSYAIMCVCIYAHLFVRTTERVCMCAHAMMAAACVLSFCAYACKYVCMHV